MEEIGSVAIKKSSRPAFSREDPPRKEKQKTTEASDRLGRRLCELLLVPYPPSAVQCRFVSNLFKDFFAVRAGWRIGPKWSYRRDD
jgi:hypothetical protein